MYLSGESIGTGTCAIATYDQDLVDDLLKPDGEDKYAIIWHASAGKTVLNKLAGNPWRKVQVDLIKHLDE